MLTLGASGLLLLIATLLIGFALWCIEMPGQSLAAVPPPLNREQQALRERLRAHVRQLAGEIGERHYQRMDRLDAAADYIYDQFEAAGHNPKAMRFGGDQYRNIVVEFPGRGRAKEIIVLGAHYDTTRQTPGADDNASGVAGLLELGRALRGDQFDRTLRLIAFANEEAPLYGTELMGSLAVARRARDDGEKVTAMFSLEMIGFYSSEPGSQHYPAFIGRFYPDRGNFIAFISNIRSSALMRKAVGLFRSQRAFPSEGMAAPTWLVPDISRSDHAAFWWFGYPAVMITDTANFRNPNYHGRGDTPATLDYDHLARVVTGLVGMVRSLAGARVDRSRPP